MIKKLKRCEQFDATHVRVINEEIPEFFCFTTGKVYALCYNYSDDFTDMEEFAIYDDIGYPHSDFASFIEIEWLKEESE